MAQLLARVCTLPGPILLEESYFLTGFGSPVALPEQWFREPCGKFSAHGGLVESGLSWGRPMWRGQWPFRGSPY